MSHYLFLTFLSFIASLIAIYIKNFLPVFIEAQSHQKIKKINYVPSAWLVKHLNYLLVILFLVSSLLISYFVGFNIKSCSLILFTWILILVAAIDFYTLYIPDALTLPMIWLGLLKEIFPVSHLVGIENALLGAIFGYLLLRLISEGFYFIKKQEAVGRGDMKLLAMIGAWLGFQSIAFVVIFASLFIFIFFLFTLIKPKTSKHKKNKYFPYAPFLCLTSVLYLTLAITHI
jgi:prepilin signal peptidase PulO-like enzyme (type II secretory pathway)